MNFFLKLNFTKFIILIYLLKVFLEGGGEIKNAYIGTNTGRKLKGIESLSQTMIF